MAKLLASDAHVVRCAHSGSEALRAAAAAADGPFDLLICDVHLPDMDGFEVMRQMKSRYGMAAGIAITGRGEAADAERARAAGFTHYLVKPVEWGALKALVVRVAAGDGGRDAIH
jgi:CheY-like chemotaxis protein